MELNPTEVDLFTPCVSDFTALAGDRRTASLLLRDPTRYHRQRVPVLQPDRCLPWAGVVAAR